MVESRVEDDEEQHDDRKELKDGACAKQQRRKGGRPTEGVPTEAREHEHEPEKKGRVVHPEDDVEDVEPFAGDLGAGGEHKALKAQGGGLGEPEEEESGREPPKARK